jgi:thiol-disulfide isomerase/thioredoxin
VTIAAFDINGDGLFDRNDFQLGTSIGLDRNDDNEFSGRDEWLRGSQIIEFCGMQFLIDGIADDGSSITLVRTALRSPRVGEAIPPLSFTTIDGNQIGTNRLRGRTFLLDFWASWCIPCIEKFDALKKLADEFGARFTIIAVNVDEPARLSQARAVVARYQLEWPIVMQGLGEADPIWKMLGGMQENRLSIPMYVLVDEHGIIRYAGNGGDDFADLRGQLRATLPPPED